MVESATFTIVHFDDVRGRYRVSQHVIEGSIGAGHFTQRVPLGAGVLAVDESGLGQANSLTPGIEAFAKHVAVDGVLSVSRLDLALAREASRQQNRASQHGRRSVRSRV